MARVREKKIKTLLTCTSCGKSSTVTEWHNASVGHTITGFSHRLPYVRGINVRCPKCGYCQNSSHVPRTVMVNGKAMDGYYINT